MRLASAPVTGPPALPLEWSKTSPFIGPLGKVTEEATFWKDTLITTALVAGPAFQYETIAEILS